MEKQKYENELLGNIVTNNFKAANVFMEAGIDFCCGGKKSLDEACRELNIDQKPIVEKLMELENTPINQAHNFNEWSLDFLADYIMNTHHKFVLKTFPELDFYTKKIASVHGENHKELIEVAEIFTELNTELTQHLKNEEEVLFPAIKEAIKSTSSEAKKTILSEITRMDKEHEFAGGAMDKINEITNRYALPDDACNTYELTFKLLKEFEDDLHIHVHLENNILFPKALKIN